MNLSKLMNDGSGEEEKKKSPEQPKNAQPPPPIGSGGQPPQTGYGGQAAPSYHQPPPSASAGQPAGQGLAPLQMPSQGYGPGQHQFHPPPAQSPSSTQQFRPPDHYSATTPNARPGSHGYHTHPSPAHQYPGVSGHAHTNSLSPTTPSHHSQTPHSVRQSPSSAMSHSAHPAQYPHHQHQHSQPSTPLAPPPPFSRSATHPDLGSPYHQRSYSGASNGVPSGSPAHHYPHASNFGESPNAAYHRQSPQLRRTSDYLSQVERERSVSVSPKTKVPPRPPSLGSRHSSQQDVYGSHHSSMQMNSAGPLAGSPNHVTQPYQISGGPPPQPFAHPPNQASEVSQPTPPSLQSRPNSYTQHGAAEYSSSLSQHPSHQPVPAPPPLIQQHSQQKMGMSNLLTPVSEVPPAINGNSAPPPAAIREESSSRPGPSIFMKPSPKPKMKGFSATPPPAQHSIPPEQQQAKVDSAQESSAGSQYSETKSSLKRSATEISAQQPPLKQRKTTARKYVQRPPWAQLSKHNPKFHHQGSVQNGGQPQPQPQQQHTPQPQPVNVQMNGQDNTVEALLGGRDPWQLNPPLDLDLIQARSILDKWEKTFRWNTPSPDILNAVQDYLWQNLERLGDVGTDPKEGTVEIEAKIGTLIDNNTDRRLQLPVTTMCVIAPDHQGNRYSFRSEMDLHEHKYLNDYLNASIQASHKPGRVNMTYKHLYETDSFHQLSSTGLDLLPKALQRHHNVKKDRLRITRDSKTGHVKARLVKIKISDLHIYNPSSYDCRITINLEVNLDRADVDPNTLIAANDAEARNEVPRVKDRLSYKHLAYSIDLTKVEMEGMPARYELEQEVDSALLRRQMGLVKGGQPSAFPDVVSGFLDNLVFLMRQRAPT